MEWWQFEDLLVTVAISLAVLIPVTGLTLRFALKPLIKDLIDARTAGQGEATLPVDEQGERMSRIEQQLDDLEIALKRLTEIVQFDRQLKPGPRDDTQSTGSD